MELKNTFFLRTDSYLLIFLGTLNKLNVFDTIEIE